MDPRITADAQRWCEAMSEKEQMRVNTGPHVEILRTVVDGDTTIVLAIQWFQLFEFPQSGSGWGEYYARAIEATLGVELNAIRVIDSKHQHVSEWEEDYGESGKGFDIEPTLVALRAAAQGVR